jgi:acyl carrier protein
MKVDRTQEAIIDIIADTFDWPMDDVEANMDKGFRDFFQADSLDLVEITMRLEEEFYIAIPDEDAERFGENCTPNQAIGYIAGRLSE